MRRIRVAHITTIDMSLQLLLLNQLLAIKRAGFEVIGISSPGPFVSKIVSSGIPHLSVPMTRSYTPLADIVSLIRLYRTVKHGRFDIVHTHNPKPGLLGQIAARLAGVPIVINTLHGFYFHDNMPRVWRRCHISIEKIAARFSDVILSQNKEDIHTAVTEGITSQKKIKFLGNGIDLHRFNPANVTYSSILKKRQEIGLPPDALIVGFVGRLVHEKGLLELFAAARHVKDRVANVRFIFIGPVDICKTDAVTPEMTRAYGISDICHFLGMRQDMPELYALMDVFVLPSHREGFPRSPMEASAMGVPCVITDIRGCREIVKHQRNGLLIPLGDISAMVDAIIEILTDRDKAASLGEEACRIALERFDERVVFEKVVSEYIRLLRDRGLRLPAVLCETYRDQWA